MGENRSIIGCIMISNSENDVLNFEKRVALLQKVAEAKRKRGGHNSDTEFLWQTEWSYETRAYSSYLVLSSLVNRKKERQRTERNELKPKEA
jgi:hypothetical protein